MVKHTAVRPLAIGIAGVLAGSLLTAGAAADDRRAAASVLKACAAKRGGDLRLARSCRASERRVSWSVTGPRGRAGATGAAGAAGPQGPPGTLATTPINIRYTATSTSGHVLTVTNGAEMSLECGNNRIGTNGINAVFYFDEFHGSTTITRYNASEGVVDGQTAPVDASGGPASLPSASVGGSVTHVRERVTGVAVESGVVHTVDLWLTRDTRQNRPVCEFIGTVTEQGPMTVVPS